MGSESSHYKSALKAFALVLPTIVLLSGCAQLTAAGVQHSQAASKVQKKSPIDPGEKASKLIAIDLVNAMVQIESLQPGQTQLHMPKPQEAFGKVLYAMLKTVGYAVQTTHSASVTHPVSFSITEGSNAKLALANGFNQIYQINIGDVKIRRDYAFSGGQVKPQSHLYLRGADSSGIQLNDSLFDTDLQQPVAGAQAVKFSPEVDRKPADVSNTESQSGASVSEADNWMSMRFTHQGASASLREGEPIQLSVVSARDARLFCYYEDGQNNIAQIFPNRFSQNNDLPAGHTVSLPGSNQWQLTATEAGQSEHFMCIAIDAETGADLGELSTAPDLQPLPVESLQQIHTWFQQAAANAVSQQRISLAVGK